MSRHTNIESLIRLVGEKQLDVTKAQITDIVRDMPDNELHSAVRKVNGLSAVFGDATKTEFILRLKLLRKQKDENSIVTSVGKITFATRNNYSYDEEKINAYLEKKKIDEDSIYDITYVVATQNPKVLADLLDKGYISAVKRINSNELAELIESGHPSLANCVTNNKTEYITGL